MKQPRWIGSREAIAIHGMQIAEHGGRAGIRDAALLESALARPVNHFLYSQLPTSIPHLAAMYAAGLVRNHPFVDGNKRVGLVVAAVFLEKNGYRLEAPQVEAYQAFMELASGVAKDEELVTWFEAHSHSGKRKPASRSTK